MLLPTCPATPMTRKTLQEEDLQREQPTLLFLPSPRVKNNCIGTHGKAGKPDGKRNQELRVNIPSAYTLYYIIYLLLLYCFLLTSQELECLVERVRTWQHSHWGNCSKVGEERPLPADMGAQDGSPEYCCVSDTVPLPLPFPGPTAWVRRRCFPLVGTVEQQSWNHSLSSSRQTNGCIPPFTCQI